MAKKATGTQPKKAVVGLEPELIKFLAKLNKKPGH
jgi:hypothetical protein